MQFEGQGQMAERNEAQGRSPSYRTNLEQGGEQLYDLNAGAGF